jgi:hypothetical protein
MATVLRDSSPIIARSSAGGSTGAKGDPGGNIMAIGLFTAAAGIAIPGGTNRVRTAGHAVDGKGAADYVYSATVDGAYVAANPATSFLDATAVSPRGFKLATDQPIMNWFMFGLHVDDKDGAGTDDYSLFMAANEWLKAQRLNGSAVRQYDLGASQPLYCYGAAYFSAGPVIDWAANFQGFYKGVPGAAATQVRFPANTTGFVFTATASGHCFEGFSGRGGFDKTSAGGAGDEGEYHFVQWHAQGVKRNIGGWDWQGDVLKDFNDVGSGTNTNGDVIDRIFGNNNRNVYSNGGGDVNGKGIGGIFGISNRQAAILEAGFLGNDYDDLLAESNGFCPGWVNVGTTAARPASLSWYGGFVWNVIGGNEVWCQTHSPPATGENNQGWIKNIGWTGTSEATAHLYGIPTWVAGLFWRPGGGVIHQGASNQSTFSGYWEGNQLNQYDSNVGTIEGTVSDERLNILVSHASGVLVGLAPMTSGIHQYGARIFADQTFNITSRVPIFGSFTAPYGATAADAIVTFKTALTYTSFQFQNPAAGGTVDARMYMGAGNLNMYGSGQLTLGAADGVDHVKLTPTLLKPAIDNTLSFGNASFRWTEIFAATGTINTSDKRMKNELPIDDALLDAWDDVRWVSYQWKDAVEKKGDAARVHFGLFAQDVEKAFKKHSVDVRRYAFFCHDEWDDILEPEWAEEIVEQRVLVPVEPEKVRRKKGEPVWQAHKRHGVAMAVEQRHRIEVAQSKQRVMVMDKRSKKPKMRLVTPAGDRFGIRYDQALAIEALWQRRRGDRIEARVAALENKPA